MRIISRKTLREFWEREAAAQQALEAWYHEAKRADWTTSADVKAKYGTASIISAERVVFNICGNKYRLVVRINYEYRIIYIRFVGTHRDYDRIDVEKV